MLYKREKERFNSFGNILKNDDSIYFWYTSSFN